MAYNVFISWSGALSRQIAAVVHDWLPTAVQAADPFLSDEDIEAGARWLPEISVKLSTIKIGLLCVTADNQFSTWLNFEAGALAKAVDDDTRVIPLAFDIEKSQIKYPLGQFNAKKFTQEDMLSVVRTINRALDQPLTEQRVSSAFELSWPVLNTRIEHLRSENAQQTLVVEESRTIEDMVEELISASREHKALLQSIHSKARMPITDMGAQYGATRAALERLGQYYDNDAKPLTPQTLLEVAPRFDNDDWAIVENAPFLYWYLTQYHGIKKGNTDSSQNLDEVPF